MSDTKIPFDAIGKVLAEAMEQAVKNGANSVSMPDEYVAIAHFLSYPEKYLAVPAVQPDRFIPDSECVQSKCKNATTGCWGRCEILHPRHAASVIVPVSSVTIAVQPVMAGMDKQDAPVETLLNAAFNQLQHDSGEGDVEYKFQRDALKKAFTRIIAGIRHAAPVAPVAEREGWKWVPVELTKEMDEAGYGTLPQSLRYLGFQIFRDHYRAAIAAAPTPPEAGEVQS